MTIILGERTSVASRAVARGVSMAWTGWDGSVWSLTTPADGVVLGPGVRGLAEADAADFEDESPGVDGSRWRGSRDLAREVFWPVWVVGPQGQEWVERDRAFRRSLSRASPGLWTVTQPNGESRSLVCRLRRIDPAIDLDPSLVGVAGYAIALVADDPYWLGAPISRTWRQAGPADFFGEGGPPFRVSPVSTLATATMRNPGDVDAWPVWRVDGPTTTVDLGVDGGVVEVPFAVPGGSSLTIDTHPTRQVALLDGQDVTGDLGEVQWRRIPAGGEVPLSLAMTGEGSVTVTVIPRFRSAW